MIRIGDFNIKINKKYLYNSKASTDYLCDCQDADCCIDVNPQDVDYERENSDPTFGNGYLEHIAIHRKIAEWLPLHNAFVLHSACFDVDGVGVAFAAHSGTGKTTHMRLWQELLGDKMVVVNGDKPIVRFFDEEPETPYAYGTPWNGKEGLGCNMRTPLKHICFIRRDEKNFVEPMDKNDIVDLILNQVYMPKDPLAMMNTMKLIDRLLGSCNLWVIHCNMEKDAAQVAYKTIIKGES